jgi:hypothetical protein
VARLAAKSSAWRREQRPERFEGLSLALAIAQLAPEPRGFLDPFHRPRVGGGAPRGLEGHAFREGLLGRRPLIVAGRRGTGAGGWANDDDRPMTDAATHAPMRRRTIDHRSDLISS